MPAETEAHAPYRMIRHKCQCDKIEREPLFEWVDEDEPELAGDDGRLISTGKVITIPTHFEGHVALDYLDVLQTMGSDAAFRWAAFRCIGVEGWTALKSVGSQDPLFQKLAKIILDRVRGLDIEAPKAS